jgi:hypothetical protein
MLWKVLAFTILCKIVPLMTNIKHPKQLSLKAKAGQNDCLCECEAQAHAQMEVYVGTE